MTSSAIKITANRFAARAWTVVAVAAVLLLGPASAEHRMQSFSEGRLWRVSKVGVGDSFVFGTIHIADPRVSVIPKPVEDALVQTRSLATELLLGAFDGAEVLEFEELDDNQRLEPLIGASMFAELQGKLAAQEAPARVIERLKPWAAMLKISWATPRGEEPSLDEQLVRAARARRMPVWSLEAVEEQVASFDSIPMDSQVALLKHAIAHRDALAVTIEPTIAAWLRGDLAALAQISDRTGEEPPSMRWHFRQLTKHIIDDRTILMHRGASRRRQRRHAPRATA